MKSHTENIVPGLFYHVHGRGINGENIFPESRNYAYFLQRYAHFIEPVAETYAYCLMPDHVHLLLRIKAAPVILTNLPQLVRYAAPDIVSQQFGHLFNSYAQAINKARHRTGGLFETPFRRLPVPQIYLRQMVHYLHCNPARHGLVQDFRTYPNSSYRAFCSGNPSKIRRAEAMDLFGGTDGFRAYHHAAPLFGSPDFERDMVIEFD